MKNLGIENGGLLLKIWAQNWMPQELMDWWIDLLSTSTSHLSDQMENSTFCKSYLAKNASLTCHLT